MESHSSFRAGFLACFSSLCTDWRKVFSPNFVLVHVSWCSCIKTYLVVACCWWFCVGLGEEEGCVEEGVGVDDG
jgi:hypothetical protein